MSQLVVRVTTIDEVREHPNADRLEIAVVGGWQCVVGKGNWKKGDKCVFFPPDTVLPQEVSDRFEVTQYLSKGRIKHTKLRGEPSFGLVVKPDSPVWMVGDDVADVYGATKYDPPVRQGNNAGVPAFNDPRFSKYTDIDNLRHYPNAFVESETVVITEKIHGANVRIGIVNGKILAGSRKLQREQPNGGAGGTSDASTYWFPYYKIPGIRHLLESYAEPQSWWRKLLRLPRKSKTVIIFGEVYGPSIQSFNYGLKSGDLGFAAFDIMVDGRYLNHLEFWSHCTIFKIPMVPIIHNSYPFNIEAIKHMSTGTSKLGGNHIREGVVVRPFEERRDPRLGRVILKYVSDAYLLLDKKTDFAEV